MHDDLLYGNMDDDRIQDGKEYAAEIRRKDRPIVAETHDQPAEWAEGDEDEG